MKKEKIVILAVSFALFMGGVFALWMDRSDARTITLALIVAGMLAIAVRQTIMRLKKKK